MNEIDIRKKIDYNNKMIREMLNPSSFILNNNVSILLKENQELQQQCTHKFEDGFCIYCDLMQES
jgi:hypothetical protein